MCEKILVFVKDNSGVITHCSYVAMWARSKFVKLKADAFDKVCAAFLWPTDLVIMALERQVFLKVLSNLLQCLCLNYKISITIGALLPFISTPSTKYRPELILY
uniref:Uncharacterized protein n=1 Tax=Schistocephalus solidus TaxID=70667 RepID=A0A0X3PA83_SCHSO